MFNDRVKLISLQHKVETAGPAPPQKMKSLRKSTENFFFKMKFQETCFLGHCGKELSNFTL